MSRLLTNRRLFIVLASLILLIVVAGLTMPAAGGAAWPERAVMDVENAIGGLIYRPVSQVTSFLSGIHDLRQMYEENARLKSELQNYAWLQSQYEDLKSENAQLRQMVDFKQSVQGRLTFVPADVVGRNPSEWNSEITIDVGRNAGVRPNMAVISDDGSLVGKVIVTGETSSKVVLITDTQLGDGVSARVQNGQADQPFGIVIGSSSQNGMLEMNFLSPLAVVKPGETVVTSGLSAEFPKGLLIGTVVKVQPGLQGVTQSALVRPSADLDYIQSVLVVTSPVVQPS
ncbi:MAG: rod shape-determining protein MreC [Alicyclobacillaceae bacterium]|nr:rod shape-determining protein MreC [Alicyclobacillaceae bacterium]